MFLGIMYYCLRTLRRIGRTQSAHPFWPELQMMASTISLSVISLAVFAFFDSIFYLPTFPLMFGLVVGLEYVAGMVLATSAAELKPVTRGVTSGRADSL